MENRKKIKGFLVSMGITLLIVIIISIFTGKYPLTYEDIIKGNKQAIRVLCTLRLPRTFMAVITGFGLGVTGMIYQTIFHNPLASPDIIGVSSGASAGAAFAILFLPSSLVFVTASAFLGSILAVVIAIVLATIIPEKKTSSIVLSGIAVHSLAQTFLMILKITADPEKELASIEYWIMGSLNAITLNRIPVPFVISSVSIIVLFLLYRQVLILSMDDGEAALLGINVFSMRFLILFFATLAVAAIVSVTGLISFIGLLAPHIARMLTKDNRIQTLLLSGLTGGVLLCLADILARSVWKSELPVSVFTSLLGAPFLLLLLIKKGTK